MHLPADRVGNSRSKNSPAGHFARGQGAWRNNVLCMFLMKLNPDLTDSGHIFDRLAFGLARAMMPLSGMQLDVVAI